MIRRVVYAGNELAVIIHATFHRDGIEFLTPANSSQQLGYMNRPAGYVILPHVHNPTLREVQDTNEVLFIRSGRVRVDFYSEDLTYVESVTLHSGDVILLARGGHGLEMLEETEIIEVKQGPYVGEADKTRFTAPGRSD